MSSNLVMRTPLATLALLALLAGPARANDAAPADGAATCLDAAVNAIQQRYESIRDLRADFVQTSHSAAMGPGAAGTRGSGTVTLAKPGRMRWSYEEPEPSLVVSDGETLWIYDPRRREVQQLPVGEGYLSGAAVQFLLGEGNLRRDFEVALLDCGERAVELALQPRRPASYEKLELRADRASGELLGTRVYDLIGNVTAVDFANVRSNLDLPPETFRFEAPADVDVIEIAPPPQGSR